ncbi:hypothetical protein V1478_013465, partial [Vespula squamosa]
LIPTYSYIQRYEKPGVVKLTSQISLPKCFQSGNLNNASNCSFRIKRGVTLRVGKKNEEDTSIRRSRRSRLYSMEHAIPKIFTCPRRLRHGRGKGWRRSRSSRAEATSPESRSFPPTASYSRILLGRDKSRSAFSTTCRRERRRS